MWSVVKVDCHEEIVIPLNDSKYAIIPECAFLASELIKSPMVSSIVWSYLAQNSIHETSMISAIQHNSCHMLIYYCSHLPPLPV